MKVSSLFVKYVMKDFQRFLAVGKEAATHIMENGLTLEEFTEEYLKVLTN